MQLLAVTLVNLAGSKDIFSTFPEVLDAWGCNRLVLDYIQKVVQP